MKEIDTVTFRIIILLCFLVSCSAINRDSREEYKKLHTFQHGIKPLSNLKNEKNKNDIDVRYRTLDRASVARGKKTYSANCMGCHGRYGHGDGINVKDFEKKPHDISNIAREVPNFEFYMKASRWKGSMPGWKKPLTEQEINDLETYLIYLSKQTGR